jgi:hypothetical protein
MILRTPSRASRLNSTLAQARRPTPWRNARASRDLGVVDGLVQRAEAEADRVLAQLALRQGEQRHPVLVEVGVEPEDRSSLPAMISVTSISAPRSWA